MSIKNSKEAIRIVLHPKPEGTGPHLEFTFYSSLYEIKVRLHEGVDMKNFFSLSIILFSINLNAAIFKCAADPIACPSGDHMHCVGYGWCGPYCDTCREDSKQSKQMNFSADVSVHTLECHQDQNLCGTKLLSCSRQENSNSHTCMNFKSR